MDSLVLLCACHIVAHWSLLGRLVIRALPPKLYPLLFQLAFLDGKSLVLRDLVAAWPLQELNVQRLLGHRKLLQDRTCIDCVQAVIQGVVDQLRQVLKEPGRHSSLRVLDMTGLPDSVSSHFPARSTTRALASACMEMSKHQQKFQRRRSKQHKGRSRATRDTAVLQPLGMDVHADLVVDMWSYQILRDALRIGPTSLLRLKCHMLKAEHILTSNIVTLLESLDRSCVQRVDLCFSNLGLTELSEILPQLSRFPELCSLKLHNRPRRSLPIVQEFSLGSSWLSGNLSQTLSDLQSPLEIFGFASRFLVPSDLPVLSLSFDAPALKRLDLSGFDVSKGFLEPLQLLLEKTSSSLLHLDLRECRMANSHLDTLLPTLLRCSHLSFLGLHGNDLSTVALKDLLQKILELPDLHLVVFPFPVDCYKLARLESDFDFVTDEELLAAATAEFSQILANSWRTDLDWTYNPDGHEALD